MAEPRRTRALVAAERAVQTARRRLAAGEPGWDPWRVADAEARLAAALADALDGGAAETPEPRDDAGRVPRMLTSAVRRGGGA